jgi:hypothetical protein
MATIGSKDVHEPREKRACSLNTTCLAQHEDPMASSSNERNPVERLAEEFASRLRRGERPALSEYTAQYPQYAEQIEELFPALVLMEQLRGKPYRTLRRSDRRRGTASGMPGRLSHPA